MSPDGCMTPDRRPFAVAEPHLPGDLNDDQSDVGARNLASVRAYLSDWSLSRRCTMVKTGLHQVRFAAVVLLMLAAPGSAVLGQDSSFVRVTGVVGDAQTGKAVANALVAIPDVGIRVLADENGRFHFDRLPPGSRTWLFQALGYADWSEEMSVEDGEHLRVGLLPQPVALETIVATASRLAERRKGAGLSVRAVPWEEIQSTAATNVAQVVADRSPHPAVNCPPASSGSPPEAVAANPHPSRVTPRHERAPLGGADGGAGLCLRWRGKIISPQIYLDEQPTPVPIGVLYQFMPHEIHTIEYYQHPARGTIIRIYTLEFMRSGKPLLPSSSLFR